MKIRRSLVFGTGPDGDQWIGSCPSLEVATVGDSREKAVEALDEAVNLSNMSTKWMKPMEKAVLDEAVNLWIESCVRRGTLREALGELGFVAVQRLPFTNDVFRIDDECYWRFPDYLPAAERQRLVEAAPESTPGALPDFQYQPHEHQTEMYG